MTRIRRSLATTAALLLIASAPGRPEISSELAAAPAAAGPVIPVSTEAQLQQAVARLGSNTTIVMAPGTYRLTRTLRIQGDLTNVAIRGDSAGADDIVLAGGGMTSERDSTAPDGIVVEGNIHTITIANLTIRDFARHSIVLTAGTTAPRIQNVRLLDAGQRFIESRADGEGGGVADGVIEHSSIEYTTSAPAGSSSAVEVRGGSGWIVRANLFRNIKAPSGQLAGPAVLFWERSRNSVVEGNTFINCQREIALGLGRRSPSDHAGGFIRNNFIYRESSVQGDAAIRLVDSTDAGVLHNTILASGSAGTLIEYRLASTRNLSVRNNLLDGTIVARDGATATVSNNYTSATPDLFVSPATGDLHLASGAIAVIDAAAPLGGAPTDWDGEPRPQGRAPDYGADELAVAADARRAENITDLSATSTLEALSTAALSGASGSSSSLPAPWKQTDVGNPYLTGAAAYGSGFFAVQAGGEDIGGKSDQFRFVYQTLDGDGEIVARLDVLQKSNVRAKAGVMIRDELTAGATHAFAIVTAAQGLAFQRRRVEGGMAVQTDGSMHQAPYWLKLKRTGNTFFAYASADGVTWALLGSDTISINRLAYVGLAVTSSVERKLTNAIFTSVAVLASETGNQPPEVSITSPASGASYAAQASVNIIAKASDPDGSIKKVDFYAGPSLIGSDSAAPFSLTWNKVPSGRHLLQAVAHDDAGALTPSSPVEIRVAGNQPPTVSLTSPAPNAGFTAPASITMTAAAADSDGTIAKVAFYAGSTLVGSDTSTPYSVTWSKAPAGTYTLSAKAWDNGGASMISVGVNVTIGGQNQLPTVSMTAPAAGAVFPAPATVTLSAQASDLDGSVAWVEFYAGAKLVGSDPSSPYTATWSNVPAGTYTLTSVARDNNAATRTSSPVSITVTTVNPGLPRQVIFKASADHASVTSYAVDVFKAGSNPATTLPFRTQKAGKPTPTAGDITVDVDAMMQALPAGTYFITVSATSPGGTSRSDPTESFLR